MGRVTLLASIAAAAAGLVACGDRSSSQTPLAPTDLASHLNPQLSPPPVAAGQSLAAQTSAGGYGARVLREEQLCFLPGIAADGTVFPLDDVPCEVQITLTNNRKGGANGWIKAVVPNESGRPFRATFADPPHLPCFIVFDSDGDGTYDIRMTTSQYVAIISASGQTSLTCHFPEGDEGLPIPDL
jgi:hypothetical protein